MSTSAAAAPSASSGPRIVAIAPGSVLLPQGADASKLGAAAQQTAATTTASPATPANQAASDASTGAAATAQPTKQQIPMSARAMGALPLVTGLAQALLGFAIMRGTLPTAGIPLIGGLPKIVIGMLVSGTSTQSIMAGAQRVLGKA